MRKWIAVLDDGRTVEEGQLKWGDIKSRIKTLSMHIDGRVYSLPSGKRDYIQAKTMASPMAGGSPVVLSRYIGFRDGNREYCLRVDEDDLECRMELN
jgi:hypothetical protein